MMISYNIYKSQCVDFSKALYNLLKNLDEDVIPVRLVFFGKPENNETYMEQHEFIASEVRKKWGDRSPVFSYVAQRPLSSEMALEVQVADKEFAGAMTFKEFAGQKYIVVETSLAKTLFTGGVLPKDIDAPFLEQSREALSCIGAILEAENMPVDSIIRQWNYIEDITALSDGSQHYQDFNDARSHFYARTEWKNGYPAATGIGTAKGGVMVEIDAIDFKASNCRAVALDNSLQIAAHEYSQQVLIGALDCHFNEKTTPKFERAKAIVKDDYAGLIYISGTAAIRGEESLMGMDIERQTIITLENIEFLVSKKNLEIHSIKVEREPKLKIFRVYLKFEKDLNAARNIIGQRYPGLPVLYVISDVCRDELLIEIEGIAG